MEANRKKILVVGSLNMDMVVEVATIPIKGQTILSKSLEYILGGKGANQAFTCGNLGSLTSMLGCVGNDDFGKKQLASLKSVGVDVSSIKVVEEVSTGIAIIQVEESGDNCISVITSANNYCDVAYLKDHDDMFQNTDYIILQMEIPLESIYYAIKRANELSKIVILNPAPANKDFDSDIYKMIDYITPNETELYMLAHCCDDISKKISIEEVEKAGQILHEKGVKNVIVTIGEKGAMVINENIHVYPTRKVKAIDTTGAGDCFNGAFVVGLADGKSIAEAVEFANIAASISVTKKGAQISLPNRKDVEKAFNLREKTQPNSFD